jgi:ribonuclease HI
VQNMGKYTRLTIHTDGASRGNPGPAATGIHIADGTTSQTVAEFGFKLGNTTNNEAEYQALLQAVEWLLERKELLADDIQIRFRLDSNLVVSQLPGTYTFEHIPREENRYADRLANDTLDKRAPDSHPFP